MTDRFQLGVEAAATLIDAAADAMSVSAPDHAYLLRETAAAIRSIPAPEEPESECGEHRWTIEAGGAARVCYFCGRIERVPVSPPAEQERT